MRRQLIIKAYDMVNGFTYVAGQSRLVGERGETYVEIQNFFLIPTTLCEPQRQKKRWWQRHDWLSQDYQLLRMFKLTNKIEGPSRLSLDHIVTEHKIPFDTYFLAYGNSTGAGNYKKP